MYKKVSFFVHQNIFKIKNLSIFNEFKIYTKVDKWIEIAFC